MYAEIILFRHLRNWHVRFNILITSVIYCTQTRPKYVLYYEYLISRESKYTSTSLPVDIICLFTYIRAYLFHGYLPLHLWKSDWREKHQTASYSWVWCCQPIKLQKMDNYCILKQNENVGACTKCTCSCESSTLKQASDRLHTPLLCAVSTTFFVFSCLTLVCNIWILKENLNTKKEITMAVHEKNTGLHELVSSACLLCIFNMTCNSRIIFKFYLWLNA